MVSSSEFFFLLPSTQGQKGIISVSFLSSIQRGSSRGDVLVAFPIITEKFSLTGSDGGVNRLRRLVCRVDRPCSIDELTYFLRHCMCTGLAARLVGIIQGQVVLHTCKLELRAPGKVCRELKILRDGLGARYPIDCI